MLMDYLEVWSLARRNRPNLTGSLIREEMKLKLNEDGTHYLKWTFLNQVWLRYNESNPGTTVMGEPAVRPSTSVSAEHGFNSMDSSPTMFSFIRSLVRIISIFWRQNQGNRKLQAFFHDALGEYKVWKDNDKLKLGWWTYHCQWIVAIQSTQHRHHHDDGCSRFCTGHG